MKNTAAIIILIMVFHTDKSCWIHFDRKQPRQVWCQEILVTIFTFVNQLIKHNQLISWKIRSQTNKGLANEFQDGRGHGVMPTLIDVATLSIYHVQINWRIQLSIFTLHSGYYTRRHL